MGQLDEDDYYSQRGRGRYRQDDDEEDNASGKMGEVYDEELDITCWRDSRDRKVQLGDFCIDTDDLIADGKINDGDPDEEESEGFTGNAGCTVDYWYRRAAIVLWVAEDHEHIQCEYGFRDACASLEKLAASKSTGEGSAFHRLATAIIARYPAALPPGDENFASRDYSGNPLLLVFAALAMAGARAMLDRLIKKLPATAFLICDSKHWKLLFDAFGPEPFEPVYNTLINCREESHRHSLFQMLAAFTARKNAVDRVQMMASRLATLAPKPARIPYGEPKREVDPPGDREESLILLAAARHVENPKDRQAILAFLLADASLAYLRGILGPVLLEKSLAKDFKMASSLAAELLVFAKAKLTAEIQRPLPPYPDWTRTFPAPGTNKTTGSYGSAFEVRPDAMRELAVFMADPNAEAHNFVRPEHERAVLEHYISTRFLDLACTTIRKGRPYTLACTKTDSSHRHALAVRASDISLLAKLQALPAP